MAIKHARNVDKCTGWPKKVSHYQIIEKSFSIVLQPVNEIRFILQIKA